MNELREAIRKAGTVKRINWSTYDGYHEYVPDDINVNDILDVLIEHLPLTSPDDALDMLIAAKESK